MSSAFPVEMNAETPEQFEAAVVPRMWTHVPRAVTNRMHGMCFVRKRRLARIATRVYQSTLELDGARLSVDAKCRRYVELVCFLFDVALLRDVLSLRLTCQSNHARRRFPVCFGTYRELEANIIEEWLGAYGACRFVAAEVIHAVIAIHEFYVIA